MLENYSLDDCLEFFYDTIFNVNAFNGEFSEEAFNREKDYIREMVKYEASNIYDIMYEAKVDAINSIEKTYLTRKEVLKNLDNISPKDLYDYYEKNVKNNTYITYISGNLEGKDRIYSLYNKYFKQKNKKIEIDIRYYDVIKIGTYEKKLINVDYKQTVLNLIYQFQIVIYF